jgi:hypothetical protein
MLLDAFPSTAFSGLDCAAELTEFVTTLMLPRRSRPSSSGLLRGY